MNIRRPFTAFAASAAIVAGALIGAPTAGAASQAVLVNCATSDVESFTLDSGDEIVFSLNPACITGLAAADINTTDELQTFVNNVADLNGTGGSAIANIDGLTWTITYTAGPNPGTDTLDISQAGITPRSLTTRSLSTRDLTTSNSYSMTVAGGGDGSTPPPWHQAYGRGATETCNAGWNPSWAQWPNNNTGGFVCVRSLVYNNSTATWDARRKLR